MRHPGLRNLERFDRRVESQKIVQQSGSEILERGNEKERKAKNQREESNERERISES